MGILKAIYSRYRKASKELRALMLDEFCHVGGYHRKYAIRLLNGPAPQKPAARRKTGPPSSATKVISGLDNGNVKGFPVLGSEVAGRGREFHPLTNRGPPLIGH